MRKIYHLSSCSSSKKILAGLHGGAGFEVQDIKLNNISAAELDEIKDIIGSYEALFSRRAMKFRSMGLADKQLTEDDYRQLILEEYTFLKRPVIVVDKRVFMGSSMKNVDSILKLI